MLPGFLIHDSVVDETVVRIGVLCRITDES